ncbi:MAG TPA: hypothetical protein DIT75_01295 [Rikenellaceae bacterium]|nr:hypothetical protein [Rikenellaceae bacterium]
MVKRLGDIASFRRGLTYSKGDEAPFSSKCVLRSNNINLEANSLDLSEIKYLREDFIIPDDRKLKANSIFICMSNGSKQHVGKVAFIEKDMDYAFGGFMGLIVPSPEVSAKFVYYACQSSAYRSFLSQVGNGIGITNLRFSDLEKFEIPLPPLAEQQRIVEELDLLSRVIELKNAQLRTLDELAQSIFCEMFGEILSNEKRWDISTIGGEFKVYSGGTPDTKQPAYWENGNISWIGSNLCQNLVLYHNDGKFITEEGLSHSSAKVFSENFVLVALVGATIGKSALLRFKTTTNQNVAGIDVPSNDRYTSEFVYMMMRGLYPLFMNVSNGKFKMANLSFVRSLPIIKPPLSLQETFSERFSVIQRQKSNVEKSIVVAENFLASRMDKYFNE